MESQRQQKFSRLIQKELGEIFQQDIKSMFGGAFITVTTVRMSPDLSVAKVFLSFLLVKDREALLEQIKSETKSIRNLLGQRIRKQVRIIPQLVFYLDDTMDYASKIDNIISKLDIPPATQEDKDKDEDK